MRGGFGNKFMDLHPVILCGGTGERLKPLSTPERPKQFMPMGHDDTLFGITCARTARLFPDARVTIVTTAMLEPLAARQAPEDARFLIEPLRRNTAAAVAMAARHARPDDILWIMPCDHLIGDEDALAKALSYAESAAVNGNIALLGIKPDSAHTGYGYIRSSPSGGPVETFTEKPDPATARAYVQSGLYWWNSGMIVSRADILVKEFSRHAPVYLDGTPYGALAPLSFDTAILEKTDKAVLVPADMGWRDVGGVDSRYLFEKTG